MNILETHENALSCPIVYFHKFMNKYKKDDGRVYIFCEGNADLGYYGSSIKRTYPDVEIEKAFVECKNNVLAVYKMINWSAYDKNRVLFFVDRDIDYWLDKDSRLDENIYVTDEYSFENDAVSLEMFMECLEDVYGFTNANEDEKADIKKFYFEKTVQFIKGSYYLMAALVVSYIKTNMHYGKEIKLSKLIDIGFPSIWKEKVSDKNSSAYILDKLRLCESDEELISLYEKRFNQDEEHYSIRGKWRYEFMVKLLDYILENGDKFAASLYGTSIKEPKKLFDLSERGGMTYLGPRIKTPESLKHFIVENLSKVFPQMGA